MSQLVVASEAIADGRVTRRELRRQYDKVFRNVYARRGTQLTAADRAVAAWLSSGRQATMVGLSAAALLGSRWVPRDAPMEILGGHHRVQPGLIVHAGAVRDDEVAVLRGIRCTTAARTAYDLGRRLPFTEGLIRVDALMNATQVSVDAACEVADRYPGARNICRLRQVLFLADGGTESPQETRVRLILIQGGLPPPVTQIRVGRRRVDMGWPEWKVGVEYDGPQHWDDPRQHYEDVGRLEYLAERQWRIVRVVAQHVRYDPQGIVLRSAKALHAAGWRGQLSPWPAEKTASDGFTREMRH